MRADCYSVVTASAAAAPEMAKADGGDAGSGDSGCGIISGASSNVVKRANGSGSHLIGSAHFRSGSNKCRLEHQMLCKLLSDQATSL